MLLPRIADIVESFLGGERLVSEICLIGDPGGKRPLRVVERFPLAGGDDGDGGAILAARGRDPRSGPLGGGPVPM